MQNSLFLVFFLVLINNLSIAQSEKTETIGKKLNDYKSQTLQEKLFVHTDRSSYIAGEIMWLKVYCLDETSNRLSGLSKVAYVEVLDKDLRPVMQAKISLKDGTGSGSIALPLNIASGNFLLRCYTNWMKNFDPAFYFHQNISIINTVRPTPSSAGKTTNTNAYDLQFFPEGGNLVSELQSKVAFRITDSSGKGINCSGTIIDQNNDTIVRFSTAKFGIGNFIFTPLKNMQYKAFVKTESGNMITQDLPKDISTGFVLNISDNTSQNSVNINVHTNTSDKQAYLVVHCRQQVLVDQLVYFANGRANIEVDKSKLGNGISTITLFNNLNEPVCERLYFKKPPKPLLINAAADGQQYSTRKKVTIHVAAKDGDIAAATSEMSMAVFLTDSFAVKQPDFYNYLWLSSELAGIIESPEYYFSDSSKEVSEATDNLMLTHGWRRFSWQEVLAGKKPVLKFLPELEGHIVNAKMVSKFNNNPGANIISFLSVPGPLFQLYAAKSTADGSVSFNTRDFTGTRLVVGQPNETEKDSFRLDFVSPFSESFSSVKPPLFIMSKNTSSTLLRRSINMQVQNVYSLDKLNVFQTLLPDTVNFYGKADAKYMLDDYVRFPTMEEVLREYVREIDVRKKGGNFRLISIVRDADGNYEIKEPVVLLDGVPQFDNGNKISHFDPLKVRKLEVVQSKYFLGPASFDGIASFSTYNGDLEGFRVDTASTVIDYDAPQIKREFYSPKYETTQEAASRLPDFRNLLYWSPEVITDATGNKEISFYTSDQTGKYAIVLQGISKQGNAGSKTFTIDVKD